MAATQLQTRSFNFAVEIVDYGENLQSVNREYILSRQVIRSGTAVGAMIREAKFAESKADYIHKFKIALKEANETEFWLALLAARPYSDKEKLEGLTKEINYLIGILVNSVNKLKQGNP